VYAYQLQNVLQVVGSIEACNLEGHAEDYFRFNRENHLLGTAFYGLDENP
jgi:hypothetical protein